MIYDFTVKDTTGVDVSMKDYKGKVLLIVNTATGCGLTPQYEGLQDLYDKYKEQGFEILDFPCNQFANQAPGTDGEIKSFCETRFGVTFKIFHKIDVNGENADPLFTYLKKEKGGMLGSNIKWNFTKFLINKKGDVVKRFAPTDTPEKIENDIKKLLGE
ncbi:glutathione peroxidase [Acetobacterium carbinolicum]|jgi:glutathione peroxidase|uniref:glutathione peroxidase n=1 Tax=Acetobacterium TaxID=33951 RepID=UPI000DBEB623|nr:MULTISPECIES: glutathione peroxidase [unclassified Acetobacterium]AWW25747.1 glutathione peroxidase [Acetobacterium sp. KB-1]MDK2941433.1 glutathione peroxidase [Acetobacterium sp.]MDZ5726597.1 glutathione peroxidase [Acetobacterium sp. K1/6]